MSVRSIVILEGDETGQELLEESLRVLDSGVIRLELQFERYDLSLAKRQETKNAIVHEAADAVRRAGFGAELS